MNDKGPEGIEVLEQNCRNFIKLITLAAKDTLKCGTGMRQKYTNLSQGISSFMKLIGDCTNETLYYSFPIRQCSMTFLEGADYAKTSFRAQTSINLAIRQLLGIIEILYAKLCTHVKQSNGTREQLLDLLEKGQMCSSIADIFQVFEFVMELEPPNEALLLKNIQTMLFLFDGNSPLSLYPDLLERSLRFLGKLHPNTNNTMNTLFKTGLRQLVLSLANSSTFTLGLESMGKKKGPPSTIVNEETLMQISLASLDVLTGASNEYIENLSPQTACDLLQTIFDSLPQGSVLSSSSLKSLAENKLLSALTDIVNNEETSYWGYAILSSLLHNHFYYWCHHHQCFGVEPLESLVNKYESLINVAPYASDLQLLGMLQCMIRLLQSPEYCWAVQKRDSSREIWFKTVNVAVENIIKISSIPVDGILESFYTSLVPVENGHKLHDACKQFLGEELKLNLKNSVLGFWISKSHRTHIDEDLIPYALDSCTIDIIAFSIVAFCNDYTLITEKAKELVQAYVHVLGLVCGGPLDTCLMPSLHALLSICKRDQQHPYFKAILGALPRSFGPDERRIQSLVASLKMISGLIKHPCGFDKDDWYKVALLVLLLIQLDMSGANDFMESLDDLSDTDGLLFFAAFQHLLFLPFIKAKKNNEVAPEKPKDFLSHTKDWLLGYIKHVQHDASEWDGLLQHLAARQEHVELPVISTHLRFIQKFKTHSDVAMLFHAIAASVVDDVNDLLLLVEGVCDSLALFSLDGNTSDACIDVGICVFEHISRHNVPSSVIVGALKKALTQYPLMLSRSTCLLKTLNWYTMLVTGSDDSASPGSMVDIFVFLVENGLEFVDIEVSASILVDCLFMLAKTEADVNLAFRSIVLIFNFAEVMVSGSTLFGVSKGRLDTEAEVRMFRAIFAALRQLCCSGNENVSHYTIKSLAPFITSVFGGSHMPLNDETNGRGFDYCISDVLEPLVMHTTSLATLEPGLINSSKHLFLLVIRELNGAFGACKDKGLLVKIRELLSSLIMAAKEIISVIIGYNQTSKNSIEHTREYTSYLRELLGAVTLVAVGNFNSGVWPIYLDILRALMACRQSWEGANMQILYSSISTLVSAGHLEMLDYLIDAIAIAFPGVLVDFAKSQSLIIDSSPVPPWLYLNGGGFGNLEPCNNSVEAIPGENVKLVDSRILKITLRSKIANSVGILQDMQLLQLVTLHYIPNMLASTTIMDKVKAADYYALDRKDSSSRSSLPVCSRGSSKQTILNLVSNDEVRQQIMSNALATLNEPLLFEIRCTSTAESRVFDTLGRLENVWVFTTLAEALSGLYLVGPRQDEDLSLIICFLERIVGAIRLQTIAYLGNLNIATIGALVPLAGKILDLLPKFLVQNPYRQLYIYGYQAVMSIARCMYCAFYVCIHFAGLPPFFGTLACEFWSSASRALLWFSTQHDIETSGAMSYTTLLHAIATESIASLVVSPFSIAPPSVYPHVADILYHLVQDGSPVLRRIALQRMSDAASFPFIAVPLDVVGLDSSILLMRARLSGKPLLLLAKRLCQLLDSNNEVETMAAICIIESIVTLPGDLVLSGEENIPPFLHARIKRPLLALVIEKIYANLNCRNSKIAHACKKLLGVFLHDIGAIRT
ncbi:Armadillo-type fold [Babesia duncani]|uniref:Armadillo-type fold n=1 Tax=Babesia duncani TaxID=323732 RepID=A0AAD9UPG6_9APIC|nr:Armadillo-type fold [Babesia duncani]